MRIGDDPEVVDTDARHLGSRGNATEVATVSIPSNGGNRHPWTRVKVATGIAAVLLAGCGNDDKATTSGGGTTVVTSVPTTPSGSTGGDAEDGADKVGRPTPDGAVIGWIESLGTGKPDAAAGLVGPLTEAYFKALGGNVAGAMVEYEESYGAWAETPDRSTTAVELGSVEGREAVVVVVSGTSKGEGSGEYRTDAIPVSKSGRGGTWLVEPAAFSGETGGRIELMSPQPGQAGLSGLAADAAIEVSAAGSGTFWFSLDDQREPIRVPGVRQGPGVRATWDPPGNMASRSHLLVVAYADKNVLTAFAGIFAVEG